MNIFISWSGELSNKVASAFYDWIPNVIQAAKPYISSADIAKGKRWPNELGEKLERINYGIICLTPDNLNAPWINFEAGALGKSLEESFVAPFLFKLKKADVPWPLAQFQLTSYERGDVLKMVQTINNLAPDPLERTRLTTVFERFWPDLQAALAPLLAADEVIEEDPAFLGRSDPAILEELLDLVRSQQRTFNSVLGDERWTFRGNARLEPLSPGDYRQVALGLGMLKCLADIERLGYHQPSEAIWKTLLALRDPLEVLLARARAPRIHSVYFEEKPDGTLGITYLEDESEAGTERSASAILAGQGEVHRRVMNEALADAFQQSINNVVMDDGRQSMDDAASDAGRKAMNDEFVKAMNDAALQQQHDEMASTQDEDDEETNPSA